MMTRAVLIGALSILTLATVAQAQDAPKGDATNGKKVFLAAGCMYCHGRSGQGGAMNYPAPPLAKTEVPFEGFKSVLRQSLRDMPAYVEAIMPDQDVADIYAFLKSVPPAPAAKDIPLLNQ